MVFDRNERFLKMEERLVLDVAIKFEYKKVSRNTKRLIKVKMK